MAKVMLTSFFQVIFNTCFPGVTLPRPGPHEAGIFSKPRMLAVVSRRAKRNFGKKGKHIIYGKYMVIIWLMMVNNGNMGGFHKWWYPRWMVYSMENPIYKWMTTSSSPILGNLHIGKEALAEFWHSDCFCHWKKSSTIAWIRHKLAYTIAYH